MSFLQGLHGTVAMIFLAGLLLVDEAGLPVPIAPNELMLLLAGVLISNGALSPWVFFPIAALAMVTGMLGGYGWARAVGEGGLRALAEHLRVVGVYDRTRQRMRAAGPMGIGVARLLPGIRPQVTLVAGASEVGMRRFLTGALPALAVWLVGWTVIGIAVGVPAEHFLGRFERLALGGGVLIVMGCLGYLGMRKLARLQRDCVVCIPVPARLPAALVIDAGVIACVVVGLLAVGRRLLGVQANGWIDLVVAVVAVVIGYAIAARRRASSTAGEALLGVRYPADTSASGHSTDS